MGHLTTQSNTVSYTVHTQSYFVSTIVLRRHTHTDLSTGLDDVQSSDSSSSTVYFRQRMNIIKVRETRYRSFCTRAYGHSSILQRNSIDADDMTTRRCCSDTRIQSTYRPSSSSTATPCRPVRFSQASSSHLHRGKLHKYLLDRPSVVYSVEL